jgi:tetratricopeptide (TPR) repeat protein
MKKIDAIGRLVDEANSLITRGEYDAAENAIRSCPYYQQSTEDSAPLYLAEINSLLRRGDPKGAMNVVRRLDRPDLSVVVNIYRFYYLALICNALGKIDEALEAVERAETIAHQNESQIDGDVLCMITSKRGYILSDLERWADALVALNEAAQVCGGNDEKTTIHIYIAYCLQAEHRYAEALQELEFLITKVHAANSELISRIQFRKGAILLQTGKFGDAYRAFLEAEGGGATELEAAIRQGKMQAAAKMLADTDI